MNKVIKRLHLRCMNTSWILKAGDQQVFIAMQFFRGGWGYEIHKWSIYSFILEMIQTLKIPLNLIHSFKDDNKVFLDMH